MRHLRSVLYAAVLAPAAWLLAAVGLTARSGTGGDLERLGGLALLLLAGAAYAALVLPPFSPAGPLLAGVAYLGLGGWAWAAPGSYSAGLPGYAVAMILAVPLLGTALDLRRWRRRAVAPGGGFPQASVPYAAPGPFSPVPRGPLPQGAVPRGPVVPVPGGPRSSVPGAPGFPGSGGPAAPVAGAAAAPVAGGQVSRGGGSADEATVLTDDEPTVRNRRATAPADGGVAAAPQDEPTRPGAASDEEPTSVMTTVGAGSARPDAAKDDEAASGTVVADDEPTARPIAGQAAGDEEPTFVVTGATDEGAGDEPTAAAVPSAGADLAVQAAGDADQQARGDGSAEAGSNPEEEPTVVVVQAAPGNAQDEEPTLPAGVTEDRTEAPEVDPSPAEDGETPTADDTALDEATEAVSKDDEPAVAAADDEPAGTTKPDDEPALGDEPTGDPAADEEQTVAATADGTTSPQATRPSSAEEEPTVEVGPGRVPPGAGSRSADETTQDLRGRTGPDEDTQVLGPGEVTQVIPRQFVRQGRPAEDEQTQVLPDVAGDRTQRLGSVAPPGDRTQVIRIVTPVEPAGDDDTVVTRPPSILAQEREDPGADPTTLLGRPAGPQVPAQRRPSFKDMERPADEVADDTRRLTPPSEPAGS